MMDLFEAPDFWVIGVAKSGDDSMIIRARSGVASEAPYSSHPIRLSVRIGVNSPNEQGLPTETEGAELAAIEDAIVASIETPRHGRLCAVVTSTSGHRDLIFHASDRAWMAAWADTTREATASHQTKFSVKDDPEWSMVRRLADRATVAAKDEEAVRLLEQNGFDTSLLHEIRYFMYFPSEASADEAAQVLVDHEYRVDVHPAEDRWLVLAAHDERPNAGIIRLMRGMLTDFCQDYGGQFDGWEVKR